MILIHKCFFLKNKLKQEKYKADKMDINNNKRAKYHDIDMEVDVKF